MSTKIKQLLKNKIEKKFLDCMPDEKDFSLLNNLHRIKFQNNVYEKCPEINQIRFLLPNRNQVFTMDYRTDRINVLVNDEGLIDMIDFG